jgi:hypothetical protein
VRRGSQPGAGGKMLVWSCWKDVVTIAERLSTPQIRMIISTMKKHGTVSSSRVLLLALAPLPVRIPDWQK